MRTTIKDIAAETGFSLTTISLVLNGKAHKIPEESKRRILDAAKKLDYRPNQLAVSLVKGRSDTIGLIVPDIGNVYFATMAKGIEKACQQYGRTVILCNSNELHKRDMEYIRILADKGVDGILYIMAKDSTYEKGLKAMRLMEELKIPYLMLDRFIDSMEYPAIVTDHIKGGYLATKHLIEMGHKKIACVTGPIRNLSDSLRRFRGFLKAMEEARLIINWDLVYEGDYSMEGGSAAVDYLMQYDFTAIFACNDASAFGVCKQLKKYKKKVPEDVAVIGYDDIIYAQMLEVPLTTIHQSVYEMGMEAVYQLLNIIEKDEKLKEFIMFEPKLVIRESTVREHFVKQGNLSVL